MNKIPKLTLEQAVSLDYSDGYSNTYVEEVANNIYLECLQIADTQGLLTKEASLSLKPDNYIEWNGWNGYAYKANMLFNIVRLGKDNNISLSITSIDREKMILNLHKLNIEIQDQAQQYCQDYLDNYLKEQENE